MRRIDELHLKSPFYGSRKLSHVLRAEGWEANRKHVQRLMRLMGLESMAPKPKTSEPHPEHVVYPYLLRGLLISRANQVWATDITYIPMKAGFMYLVAIMDWFTGTARSGPSSSRSVGVLDGHAVPLRRDADVVVLPRRRARREDLHLATPVADRDDAGSRERLDLRAGRARPLDDEGLGLAARDGALRLAVVRRRVRRLRGEVSGTARPARGSEEEQGGEADARHGHAPLSHHLESWWTPRRGSAA